MALTERDIKKIAETVVLVLESRHDALPLSVDADVHAKHHRMMQALSDVRALEVVKAWVADKAHEQAILEEKRRRWNRIKDDLTKWALWSVFVGMAGLVGYFAKDMLRAIANAILDLL